VKQNRKQTKENKRFYDATVLFVFHGFIVITQSLLAKHYALSMNVFRSEVELKDPQNRQQYKHHRLTSLRYLTPAFSFCFKKTIRLIISLELQTKLT
jgi:hypothetical protein